MAGGPRPGSASGRRARRAAARSTARGPRGLISPRPRLPSRGRERPCRRAGGPSLRARVIPPRHPGGPMVGNSHSIPCKCNRKWVGVLCSREAKWAGRPPCPPLGLAPLVEQKEKTAVQSAGRPASRARTLAVCGSAQSGASAAAAPAACPAPRRPRVTAGAPSSACRQPSHGPLSH